MGRTGPAGPSGGDGADISDFLYKKRDTVVAIFDSGNLLGSGVRISSDEVLTAHHVIDGHDGLQLAVKGVGLVYGTVQGYDANRDVALLTFTSSQEGGEIAPFSSSKVGFSFTAGRTDYTKWGVGYEVAVVGYASSISETTPIATFGRIGVLWNIIPGDHGQGQFDAATAPGMSGGAVFNKWGDLIGIVLRTDPDFAGNSRFLLVSEIGEVIEDLRDGERIE